MNSSFGGSSSFNAPGVSGQTSEAQQPSFIQLADFANILVLIGSIIVVATKKDAPIVASAFIKIIAGFLYIKTAFDESKAQQIAPGVTTPANRLKIAGSIITIIGALLLTRALLMEVYLKSQGVSFSNAPISPYVGGTGAFTV